jgi:hypothetical protein
LAIVRGLELDFNTKKILKNAIKDDDMQQYWLTMAGQNRPRDQIK